MQITTNFVVQTCCNSGCGINFAVPADWDRNRRNDHSWFYCPNGHRQHYNSESEEERLKRQLQQANHDATFAEQRLAAERESHAHTLKRLSATKGVVTKARRRAGHGVCPVDGCRRHFNNLDAHMKHQHPAYAKDAAE